MSLRRSPRLQGLKPAPNSLENQPVTNKKQSGEFIKVQQLPTLEEQNPVSILRSRLLKPPNVQGCQRATRSNTASTGGLLERIITSALTEAADANHNMKQGCHQPSDRADGLQRKNHTPPHISSSSEIAKSKSSAKNLYNSSYEEDDCNNENDEFDSTSCKQLFYHNLCSQDLPITKAADKVAAAEKIVADPSESSLSRGPTDIPMDAMITSSTGGLERIITSALTEAADANHNMKKGCHQPSDRADGFQWKNHTPRHINSSSEIAKSKSAAKHLYNNSYEEDDCNKENDGCDRSSCKQSYYHSQCSQDLPITKAADKVAAAEKSVADPSDPSLNSDLTDILHMDAMIDPLVCRLELEQLLVMYSVDGTDNFDGFNMRAKSK